MANKIFKVNDGSIWYFDADSHADARWRWIRYNSDQLGEPHVVDNLGEPEISFVTTEAAAQMSVTLDEVVVKSCKECGCQKTVPKEVTLLHLWREEQAKPDVQRAPFGALCNSEWP